MSRVLVVGGGPAGMLAAYAAASRGNSVTLFEQNEKLGKKLYLTGKGRCNVTNACATEDFFAQVPRNAKFLYSALYSFPADALLDLLHQAGLPTKVERGGRVFPESDKSSDVIWTLARLLEQAGVRVCLHTPVDRVLTEDGTVVGVRLRNGQTLPAQVVILATGGVSYPATGSTGDGHRMAAAMGHTVTELQPSLVPMTVRELQTVQALQGLTLKNVNLCVMQRGKPVFNEQGELLFTHFGISGPLVLSASACLKTRDFSDVHAQIDLKPALIHEKLDARVLREFLTQPNKQLKSILPALVPARLATVVAEAAEVPLQTAAHAVTREQRAKLVNTLKALALTITGVRGMREAIITRGGVQVREVDPSTMQSKLVRGLYFVGELLDVDAYTGGYNL